MKTLEKKKTAGNYLNMNEAASYIGCSYNTLRNFINKGLNVILVGSVKRIAKSDIDEFMQAHKVTGGCKK